MSCDWSLLKLQMCVVPIDLALTHTHTQRHQHTETPTHTVLAWICLHEQCSLGVQVCAPACVCVSIKTCVNSFRDSVPSLLSQIARQQQQLLTQQHKINLLQQQIQVRSVCVCVCGGGKGVERVVWKCNLVVPLSKTSNQRPDHPETESTCTFTTRMDTHLHTHTLTHSHTHPHAHTQRIVLPGCLPINIQHTSQQHHLHNVLHVDPSSDRQGAEQTL